MTRSLLSVILLAASGTAASAGTYVGIGIGSGASVDSSKNVYAADGRSGRLMLGWRFANLAVEGAVSGYGLQQTSSPGQQLDSRSASAALKLSLPLGGGFEAFGRGGLIRTWLSPVGSSNMETLSGNGLTLSAGFEYRLNLGLADGSLFVDYCHNTADLTGGNASVQQTATMWTLGLTVAI